MSVDPAFGATSGGVKSAAPRALSDEAWAVVLTGCARGGFGVPRGGRSGGARVARRGPGLGVRRVDLARGVAGGRDPGRAATSELTNGDGSVGVAASAGSTVTPSAHAATTGGGASTISPCCNEVAASTAQALWGSFAVADTASGTPTDGGDPASTARTAVSTWASAPAASGGSARRSIPTPSAARRRREQPPRVGWWLMGRR